MRPVVSRRHGSGYPLQPQQIVQKIKEHMVHVGLKPANGDGAPKLIGDVDHREGDLGLHHLHGVHELLRGVERAGAR